MTARSVSWAALAMALVAGAASPQLVHARKRAAPQKRADAEPARCERFTQETDKVERAIDFHLKNVCSVEIRCSVSWHVRCEGAVEGGGAQSLQLVVAPGGSETARASAQSCGDAAWSISAAEWSCRRTSPDTATR